MADIRCVKYVRDCTSCIRFYGHSGCAIGTNCDHCSIGPHCQCLEECAENEETCPYYKKEESNVRP